MPHPQTSHFPANLKISEYFWLSKSCYIDLKYTSYRPHADEMFWVGVPIQPLNNWDLEC